jgi:hypothetical protein
LTRIGDGWQPRQGMIPLAAVPHVLIGPRWPGPRPTPAEVATEAATGQRVGQFAEAAADDDTTTIVDIDSGLSVLDRWWIRLWVRITVHRRKHP